jgi:hypothetical protein
MMSFTTIMKREIVKILKITIKDKEIGTKAEAIIHSNLSITITVKTHRIQPQLIQN